MRPRYCMEILDDKPASCCYSYFDTDEYLAQHLFSYLHVDVEIEMEFHYDDTPYRIILCHIQKKDREAFLRAIDLLPGLMVYAGHTDYEAFCRCVMLDAREYMMHNVASESTMVQ